MGFLPNPIDMAKKEILKPDFNHNGIPDAIEYLEAGEKGLDHVAAVVSIFDESDMSAMLAMIPTSVKNKINAKLPGGLDGLAKSIVAIPPALRTAEAVLKTVEDKLKAA